jgi:DNA-binding CsgD family transcriptional regulator
VTTVIGRERELAQVASFLDGMSRGFRVLVLSGAAGIGKTTIWEQAVASGRERGYRVAVARPTEVETGLAFAALNDLIGDLADEADTLADLPEPQRVALEAALLRIPATSQPQPLAVSVAAGHVIREAAARRPLLIAIDDTQWLDEPTARVLAFVLRRLDTEAVGVVAGQRAAGDEAVAALRDVPADRISRIEVPGLTVDEVDRVLRSRLRLDLPRPTLVRLHRVSGGNSFYAIELGRAMAAGGTTDGDDELAVPPSLDGLVGQRLDGLGPDGETVALYAAAAAQPSTGSIAAAIGPAAVRVGLAAAVGAGVLIADGEEIRFVHPLLAAAAYGRASAERRRAVHTRLAEIATEPEERAMHLARAAERREEVVAGVLEDAALTVSRRGAPEAAARLAERAADLTPERQRSNARRRMSLAAQEYLVAGDVARVRSLLQRLTADAVGPVERAEALTRMAHLHLVQGEWDEARVLYHDAASIVDDDPGRRIPIELGLAGLGFVTWREWRDGAEHAATALRLAEELGDPTVLFQTLGHAASWRSVLDGDWRELMERADRLAPMADDVPGVEHPDVQFARMLRDAGDFDEALERVERRIDRARETGDWHGLPRLLLAKAAIQIRLGEIGLAEETLDAATTGVLQTGEGAWLGVALVLSHTISILRGDVDGARDTEDSLRARIESNPALARERWATTVNSAELEFALGDAPAADRRISPLIATAADDPLAAGLICSLVVLGVETRVAIGRVEDARALFEYWVSRLRRPGIRWIDAETARAEALLLAAEGDIDGALAASDASIALADGTRVPYVHGRALLAAGEIRRRARQKARAREAFEAAILIFGELGARLWTERARSELARVAQKRPPGSPLTATEREVVELVAAGRTNREIADTLFMSVHTVEAHLTRLFRAFDVQSRTELARLVIEGTDPRLAPRPEPSGRDRGPNT